MIASLTGRLASKRGDYAVVDVHGIGFGVSVSASTFERLPAPGGEVSLRVHTQVREDAISLFGFATDAEKETFELLVSVSGVGAKLALAMLSSYDPDALARMIRSEDVAGLSSIPGIGKKTAQRIALELKDKVASFGGAGTDPAAASFGAAPSSDVADALYAMGFSEAEVAVACAQLPEGLGVDASLRQALKLLGGRS